MPRVPRETDPRDNYDPTLPYPTSTADEDITNNSMIDMYHLDVLIWSTCK